MLRILFFCLFPLLVTPVEVPATLEKQLLHFEQQIEQFKTFWEETRQLQQQQKQLSRNVAQQKTDQGFGPADQDLNRQLLNLRKLSGELRSRRKQLKQIREELRTENQRLKEKADSLTEPQQRQAMTQQLRQLNRRFRKEVEKQRPDPAGQAEKLLLMMDRPAPPRRKQMLRERAREVLQVIEKRLKMIKSRGDTGPRARRLESIRDKLSERLGLNSPAGNPALPPENGQPGE